MSPITNQNPLATQVFAPANGNLFAPAKNQERSWANRGIAFIAHPIFFVLASIQLVKAIVKSVCIVFFDANSVAVEWRLTAKHVEKLAQSFLCTFTGKALFQTTGTNSKNSFAMSPSGTGGVDDILQHQRSCHPKENWEGIGYSFSSIVSSGQFYEKVKKKQYEAIADQLLKKLATVTNQNTLLRKLEGEVQALRKYHNNQSIQVILYSFWTMVQNLETKPNSLKIWRDAQLTTARSELITLLSSPKNFFHSLHEILKNYSLFQISEQELFQLNLTDEAKKNYIVQIISQELIENKISTMTSFHKSLRILLQNCSLPISNSTEIIEGILERLKQENNIEKLRAIRKLIAIDLVIEKSHAKLDTFSKQTPQLALYHITTQMNDFISKACQDIHTLHGIQISRDEVLFRDPKLLLAFLPELLFEKQKLILTQVEHILTLKDSSNAIPDCQEALKYFSDIIPKPYSIQWNEIQQEIDERRALKSLLQVGGNALLEGICQNLGEATNLELFWQYLISISNNDENLASRVFWYITSTPEFIQLNQELIRPFRQQMLHKELASLNPIMGQIINDTQLTNRQKIDKQFEILCKFTFDRSKYFPSEPREIQFYHILESQFHL